MHGHGSKPHLCTYPDCERSLPGNGFPRRYNLFDHMKRVHDYTGPTSPPERSASAEDKRLGGRKRKSAPSGSSDTSEKRSKTGSSKEEMTPASMLPPQSKRDKQMKLLRQQFSERKASLGQRLQALQGPADVTPLQQLNEDVAALLRIAGQLNELG